MGHPDRNADRIAETTARLARLRRQHDAQRHGFAELLRGVGLADPSRLIEEVRRRHPCAAARLDDSVNEEIATALRPSRPSPAPAPKAGNVHSVRA